MGRGWGGGGGGQGWVVKRRNLGSVLGEMGTDTVLVGPESWGGLGDAVVSSYKQGGTARAQGLSPKLPQSQPRGAGLAAGRLHCGHIWGTAAGPGPE